ncbi:MAG: NlpC/P60 family protein [Pseudomonadota bacterium]
MSKTASKLDPRRHAYRADLAADALRGKVEAERFVSGEVRQVVRANVPVRAEPSPAAQLTTEALFGAHVTVYDEEGDWAWGQIASDDYVGYLPRATLSQDVSTPTHRISAIGTFVYPAPDIKAPPLMTLSMNAGVTASDVGERFIELQGGGFIIARHVAETGRTALDFVEVAERFIGTPYMWGGKTRMGLDCSGLVQVSLEAAGLAAPRDSDMQQEDLGDEVLIPSNLEGLRRGDLIFWKGHVGMMMDGLLLLHCNAHHMATAVEPLAEAVARITRQAGDEAVGAGSGGITAIRRLPALGFAA